jgi:prepilin-type N-terminal cleavage/methylation domain-containing protein
MKRQHQRGYNLIELLIAIAILGVVLLSVLSLFIWGRKNVYSGKQMTTAIAIGTRVVEDLAPLTKEDIYNGVFDITDAATGTQIKFGNPEKTYENAAARSTKAGIIASYADLQKQRALGPKFLDKWTLQLQETLPNGTKRDRLLDGAVTVILTPASDTVTPAKFGTAAIMRVRVIVSWSENRRRREIILDSVKAS